MAFPDLNPTWIKRQTQAFRNKYLVGTAICKYEPREYLVSGDTIQFGLQADVRSQGYTPGVLLDIDSVVPTVDELKVDQTEVVTFKLDDTQLKQSAVKDFERTTSMQAGYRLASNVDQKILKAGSDNASGTLYSAVPTGLTDSTMFKAFADAGAELRYQAAGMGGMFTVIDPAMASLIEQEVASKGFSLADSALRNGYAGEYKGFKTYVSNNLESTGSLKMSVNPTAGDTIKAVGATWTFVLNGTALAEGEISIGANVAATQVIVRDAINGTGTPGATTYVDVNLFKRRTYQAASLLCGAFAANIAPLTAFGRIGGFETFTEGTDGFGVESNTPIWGIKGAIALAMQQTPRMKKDGINAQIADEYKLWQLYGTGVFSRNAEQLVKLNNLVAGATY